ncbi:unnamed protein product, partial [Nesidiocoris tenuis]
MFPVRIPGALPGSLSGAAQRQAAAAAAAGESRATTPDGGGGDVSGASSQPAGASGYVAAKRGAANRASKAKVKLQVKPFTKQSLNTRESRSAQIVKDYGFQPKRKLSVEDGSVLPCKYEPFPSHLYGKPLEEIDNFIYEE